MAVWPRSALIGGVAVGLILAVVGLRTRWAETVESSRCPRALTRSAPSTIDDASQLIAICSSEDIRVRLGTASLPDVIGYRSPELPPAAWFSRQHHRCIVT